MKLVCGLGNPGGEYEATRHNVGWWVVEALRRALALPGFHVDGPARTTTGTVDGEAVRLVEPLTYVNRSGAALAPLVTLEGFDIARDLLVVVDDINLDVGRSRFRAHGSAGGHNGLKSIESALGTREYPRLRIGVGMRPPDVDLAEWVLSPFPPEDEAKIRERIPGHVACITTWLKHGTDVAVRECNR